MNSDSEDSRSLDTDVRDQLNSTLLNESQAKNLQELDELGMSPILDAGILCFQPVFVITIYSRLQSTSRVENHPK